MLLIASYVCLAKSSCTFCSVSILLRMYEVATEKVAYFCIKYNYVNLYKLSETLVIVTET